MEDEGRLEPEEDNPNENVIQQHEEDDEQRHILHDEDERVEANGHDEDEMNGYEPIDPNR
jgi:hypothetical protein